MLRRYPSLQLVGLSLLSCLSACAEAQLAEPRMLWGLLLLPSALLLYRFQMKQRERLLKTFSRPSLLGTLLQRVSVKRQRLKLGLQLAAAAALVFCLAQPRYGASVEEVETRGIDVMVVLDVSRSMLAKDAESGDDLSRLTRAKRELVDLLDRLKGDRIGLVAFAGTAFVECPLTADYRAARLFVDHLGPELIPVPGTAIGHAIHTALTAFRGAHDNARAIILITDGEDHQGDALAAAEEAKTVGVPIFAIGIGRPEGAPIPNAEGSFHRDRSGKLVLSRVDHATLQAITEHTGGVFTPSVSGDFDLESIYDNGIRRRLETSQTSTVELKQWTERFQWPLGLALLLLALEALIAPGNRRRKASQAASQEARTNASVATEHLPPPMRQTAAILLMSVLPTLGHAAESPASVEATGPGTEAYRQGDFDGALEAFGQVAESHPDDARAWLNLGAAHYKKGDLEAASQAFQKAYNTATSDRLQGHAAYDLGNTHVRAQRFKEALTAYEKALEHLPQDGDIQHNLQAVKKWLEEQPPQQNPDQNQDKEHEDGEDQTDPSPSSSDPSDDEKNDQNQAQPDKDQAEQESQQPPQENEAQGQKNEATEDAQMTREEAEAYLRHIEDSLSKRRRRPPNEHAAPLKDW